MSKKPIIIPGGLGGKDAIGHLRKIYPIAKVIDSSGYSNNPVMVNYKKHGFDAVMVKAYTIGKLQEVLIEVDDVTP